MVQNHSAFLGGRDEMFVIRLEDVIYMQADDHYTHIFYSTEQRVLVPYGLSAVEQACEHADGPRHLLRLGRKYMVNIDRIIHINFVKGIITLLDMTGKSVTLSVSKPVLRGIADIIQGTQVYAHIAE